MISPKRLFQLFVKAAKAWSDDFAPSMGAAISYYTVFSLAPLLIIVIALAGAVFGREAVQGQIVAQLSGLIGAKGASIVETVIANASLSNKGVAGLISLVVLIIGATSVFAELQNSLDRIWHIPAAQKPKGIMAMLRARLLSVGLILGLVFLLIVSLAVSTAVAAFGSWAGSMLPASELLLHGINIAVSLSISTVLFAMIYKLMPSTPIAWRDVWVGGFTTAALFEVGKMLISLYIGKSNLTQAFAAAGSLVVLLAWVYYAAQIFLLGAEFTKVYADEHGSRTAKKAMTQTAQTAAVGMHTEIPIAKPAQPRHSEPAPQALRPSPVARAADAGLNAALTRLVTEVVAVAVLSVAGSLMSRKRKSMEKKIRWGRRAHQR